MSGPTVLAALLTAFALAGCQSGTTPPADSDTAENKVLAENPKYKQRQPVFAAAPRVD
jgi:hypothetical protein